MTEPAALPLNLKSTNQDEPADRLLWNAACEVIRTGTLYPAGIITPETHTTHIVQEAAKRLRSTNPSAFECLSVFDVLSVTRRLDEVHDDGLRTRDIASSK